MGLPAGVHCYTDTGETQPDVVGSLLYHLEGISRPDLATHQFQETLQREGGFAFSISAGVLQVDGRKVDFGDGTARFAPVRRGSDAWRRLQDLEGTHKLSLALEARDGTRLAVDLVQARPRGGGCTWGASSSAACAGGATAKPPRRCGRPWRRPW